MVERMLRRGLPRVAGGEPWPPSIAAPAVENPVGGDVTEIRAAEAEAAQTAAVVPAPPQASEVPAAAVHPAAPAAGMRRGLPRVAGGEPWPPVTATPSASTPTAQPAPMPTVAAEPNLTAPVAAAGAGVRRGLPRAPGGEPWPPAGTAAPAAAATADAPSAAPSTALAPAASALPRFDVSTPLPWTRTVWPGTAPRHADPADTRATASGRPRPTGLQLIAGLFAAAGLGILAGAGIALVRALLSMPFMQDFLTAYPGEYHPAIAVEPGFAPWIGWQHFFNVFLMILIIRSGLQVRTEKRPTVFWTPRRNSKGKISLALWFHQSLDILWLVNGVIFVVLLFVTGHWVRIVPTSWEVFPNALSAVLQYISFDWPTENGWVNYNSVQQLAYFATVFIAAPLATITGFRMSGLWPKKAERLSKLYPVEWARALHFPVMLYFVAFIIVHVALVFLTGFLRNLNHMYASQDAVTWTGFWVFVASLAVIVAGWVAARPLVLAPIAKMFGQVSGR